MSAWRRVLGWGSAGLLVLGASACTSQEKPVDHPKGSYGVVVNQPTPVGSVGIVASRLQHGEVSIDVLSEGKPVVGKRMSVGDEATLSGFTFKVIAIDMDNSEQPEGKVGGNRTTVWILPTNR